MMGLQTAELGLNNYWNVFLDMSFRVSWTSMLSRKLNFYFLFFIFFKKVCQWLIKKQKLESRRDKNKIPNLTLSATSKMLATKLLYLASHTTVWILCGSLYEVMYKYIPPTSGRYFILVLTVRNIVIASYGFITAALFQNVIWSGFLHEKPTQSCNLALVITSWTQGPLHR